MEKLSVQKLYKLDKALYLDTLLSHPLNPSPGASALGVAAFPVVESI